MIVTEIIAKKRDGLVLTADEIRFIVEGVTTGSIPDYQVSAWLMAVFLRSMNGQETLDLTLAMRDSGECIDLSDLSGPNGSPTLDKHSTGGVGDKTTLVVVPILAACGVSMLKMSGRGLGYSGGTVDKLESIRGFRTDLTLAKAKEQVRRIGAALIGQSQTLAPADKALYALRDVTATVESIPLIASSIMSKKLASGGQRIVLDVKVGSGAFMKTREQARTLARELVRIGSGAGIPTSAVLTSMEEPLGRTVGNALEVREAVELLLSAEGEPKFQNLCLELAAHGLLAVGKAANQEDARIQVATQLSNGQAAKKFAEIVAAQGGPDTCEDILAALPIAPIQYPVSTATEGIVVRLDAETIGRLSVMMGAGRRTKTDTIDPAVGIVLHYKCGEAVETGATLATLHVRKEDEGRVEEWAQVVRSAYVLDPHVAPPAATESLVLEVIK
jgi:pyrimidine-nucleoside phosphorylase